MDKKHGSVLLVRAPTHDQRWRLWPPHLLECCASVLMFAREKAHLIDAAARGLNADDILRQAGESPDTTVAIYCDQYDRRTVAAWLAQLRQAFERLPLAVLGPCGEPDIFFRAGANLVLTGEADGAALRLAKLRPDERIHLEAYQLLDPADWPLPAREHMPPESYYDRTIPLAHPPLAVVEAARAAPDRYRSTEAVAGDIDMLCATQGVRSIALLAPDLWADNAWLEQLAGHIATRRYPVDLIVQVSPTDRARELARTLRWCRTVHVTVALGELPEPNLAERTCRELVRAGLAVRLQIDAALPEPLLKAALHVARRGRAHDIIFTGAARRLETTRARKRYLQMPWTMARNLALATVRRPTWWLDLRHMIRPLIER